MERARLEAMKNQIETLDAYEQERIFEIIKEYSGSFTKTTNGALVSSETLPLECLEKIEKMISFFNDQHKILKKR